jgi:hypothetical protein
MSQLALLISGAKVKEDGLVKALMYWLGSWLIA